MELITITEANFEQEVLRSPIPVLLDFSAPWCGPCRMMEPAIEEIASEYAGKVKVCTLNIDDNQDTANRFNIRSVPQFLLFRDGKEVQRIMSAVPKKTIVAMLEQGIGA